MTKYQPFPSKQRMPTSPPTIICDSFKANLSDHGLRVAFGEDTSYHAQVLLPLSVAVKLSEFLVQHLALLRAVPPRLPARPQEEPRAGPGPDIATPAPSPLGNGKEADGEVKPGSPAAKPSPGHS